MSPFRDPDGSADGTYYRRLEVGPGASHGEIVRSYRRLALGVHPDAHPEDPEASVRFRQITEAYEVLGDPLRRQAYDGTRPSRRRIPVQRYTTGTTAAAFEETTQGESRASRPPTVLGASTSESVREMPLRAGPVHTGPSSGSEEGTAGFTTLLFEILDSWWRR